MKYKLGVLGLPNGGRKHVFVWLRRLTQGRLHHQDGAYTWILQLERNKLAFPFFKTRGLLRKIHSTCTHTHLNFIYHFFASSTSQNVEQFYSSYFYDWSLQSRLLSRKSESCFNNASSARLIIFSLLLTVSLPFLKVTVAFAFLIKSSIKFTF